MPLGTHPRRDSNPHALCGNGILNLVLFNLLRHGTLAHAQWLCLSLRHPCLHPRNNYREIRILVIYPAPRSFERCSYSGWPGMTSRSVFPTAPRLISRANCKDFRAA